MSSTNASALVQDQQFKNIPFKLSESEHRYGTQVHLLANPFMNSVLARIGRPEVHQPLLNHYVSYAYSYLLEQAMSFHYPRVNEKVPTRMKEFTEKGIYWGEILRPETRSIVVGLARAGTYPAHLCFEMLNYLLEPSFVRQDHFYMQRKTDNSGRVVGVDVSGSKIGGDQKDAFVFFPDPMGATGGSLCHCLDHYKKKVEGKASKYIALHLIVTPEYLKRVTTEHPDVEVFALRLDRGLSGEKALKAVPGEYWEEERGLTDIHYIVPGAGGVGEVLNNSFV